MTYRMKFLLVLLSLSLIQMTAPTAGSAQSMDGDRERQKWESEQDRRRAEEGEHFDEEAYQLEKAQMVRRQELEERRMLLDQQIHEAFRALDDRDVPGLIYEQEREAIEQRHRVQISEQIYHSFRLKITTDFGLKLPPISV